MRAPSGGTLDSFVELIGPSGQTLTTDDDSSNGLNSLISSYILPETGDCTIVSHSSSCNSQGGFSLTFQIGTPVPTPTMPLPPSRAAGRSRWVRHSPAASQALTARSTSGRSRPAAGDIVQPSRCAPARPNTWITFLELVSPGGLTLIVDDDGGSGLDARIANFVLPEAGTYRLACLWSERLARVVRDQPASRTSPRATPPPPTPGPSPTPFDRAVSLSGGVQARAMPGGVGDRFELPVDEGRIVEVRLQVMDGPARLQLVLREPSGPEHVLVDYDEACPSRCSCPVFFLPEAGTACSR